MKKNIVLIIGFLTGFLTLASADGILIPMDNQQTNHLKAYGVAYWALQQPRVYKSEWLLNYRGGSYVIYETANTMKQAVMKGVSAQTVTDAQIEAIHKEIEGENMEVIPLEKAPKVAVYAPPTNNPWDDAVTLALNYAEIPFDQIWDKEVLAGRLNQYDWLHLHHEDFTGQYGKFYRSFFTAKWYQDQVRRFEAEAHAAGFAKVQQHKGAVAKEIRTYVKRGGFLFAMCAACDSMDIALAADGLDIIEKEIDGDGVTPNFQSRLDFTKCFAFQNFTVISDPMIYEFSDIDTSLNPVTPRRTL